MPDKKIPFSVEIKSSDLEPGEAPNNLDLENNIEVIPSEKDPLDAADEKDSRGDFVLFTVLMILIVGALAWYFFHYRSGLEQRLEHMQNEILTTTSGVTQIVIGDENAEERDKKLEQLATQDAALEEKNGKIETGLLSVQEQLKSLETEFQNVKKTPEVALPSEDFQKLESQIQSLQKTISDLQKNMKTPQPILESSGDSELLKSLQKEVAALKSQIASVSKPDSKPDTTELETLKKEIANLRAGMAEVKGLLSQPAGMNVQQNIITSEKVYIAPVDTRAFDTCGKIQNYANEYWFSAFSEKAAALPRFNEFESGVDHTSKLALDDIDQACYSRNGKMVIALVAAPYGNVNGFQMLRYNTARNVLSPAIREDFAGAETNWYQKNLEQLSDAEKQNLENFRWFPTPSEIGPRRGGVIEMYGEFTHDDGVQETSTFWYDFEKNEIWIKHRCLEVTGETVPACYDY